VKYTIVLLADPEGGYTAVVPALPGCVSEGDSFEEALCMVKEAVSMCLESDEGHEEEIPVEHPGTLIAQIDMESGDFWMKDILSLRLGQVPRAPTAPS